MRGSVGLKLFRVGLDCVELGWVGLGWVGLVWVGLGVVSIQQAITSMFHLSDQEQTKTC